MIEGCIFDLDGVIVDTAKYHFLAWQQLAKKLGIPFTHKDNERLKGISRMESLDILLNLGNIHGTAEEKTQWAFEKNQVYLQYIETLTEKNILPGVKNFLLSLNAQNIPIALGSASKNAVTILKGLNLLELFDAVIDGNKTKKAKPDPQVFLLASQALKLPPERCIVFEDASAGVEAAHAAGMLCVGVGSHSNLPHADFIISGFGNVSFDKTQVFPILYP